MKTAAAYIRVSTDDQIEYSPDSQLKAIRAYAKSNDMLLPEEFVFVDEGISGRKAEKRPAFQKMIGTAKIKPKPFDVILLWKFSRFARNREDSIVYKSMLRKQCGIDVISISEQLGEDKTSILIEALIEAMDEYYSVNLAEEVRRGMNEKFSRGEIVSQPPFGYRMENGSFVPDETNAPIVKMIFNDYIAGLGSRAIATKLNNMGIKSIKGNKFENRTVEYILTNPVYIGKLRRSKNGRDNLDYFHQSKDNTLIVNGNHEPIIDEELFADVQVKRQKIKKIYGKYARQAPVEFMLKGIMRCSNCGATLVHSNANSVQCHNYARGSCKISHNINIKKLNAIVIEKIKDDFKNFSFSVSIDIKSVPQDDKVQSLTALIEKENKKLERIREAYEAGVDSLEEYKINKEKITLRITTLTEQFSSLSPKSTDEIKEDLYKRIKSGLAVIEDPNASETVKNMAIRSFIDKIIFIKPHGVIELHYKF